MKLTLHDIHLFSSIKFYSSSDISFILVSQSKSSACFAMPPQLVSLKVLVYYYYIYMLFVVMLSLYCCLSFSLQKKYIVVALAPTTHTPPLYSISIIQYT